MVLDRNDLVRALEGDVFAERILDEMRHHSGEMIVRETPIAGDEHPLAGCDVVVRHDLAPRDDLFHEGARALIRRQRIDVHAVDPWQLRLAVLEQATRADHVLRDLVASFREHRQRNGFASGDPIEHRELGGRQDADVVAVLPVDTLEILGDDESDARRFLGKRARLARRPLAVPLACHENLKAAAMQRADADRHLAFHLERDVRVAREPLVVIEADGGRRDLVGRDVVAQRHALREGQVLSAQLAAHRVETLRQEKRAAGEADRRHPAVNRDA